MSIRYKIEICSVSVILLSTYIYMQKVYTITEGGLSKIYEKCAS